MSPGPRVTAITVAGLRRYPVKSMRGERVDALRVTPRGAQGDRAHALIEAATGNVASAKRSRVWGGLFACTARYAAPFEAGGEPPPVRITLPDGATVASGDSDCEARLSAAFGREVRLGRPSAERLRVESEPALGNGGGEVGAFRLPAGVFVDAAPLHLLTTATLAALARLYPAGRFDPRRFRPNLLLATPPEAGGFVEDGWPGRELWVGGVRLRVTAPTERCIMTTLPQGDDLPHDPGIMRTLLAHHDARAGVYAEVVEPGEVRVGDRVEVV